VKDYLLWAQCFSRPGEPAKRDQNTALRANTTLLRAPCADARLASMKSLRRRLRLQYAASECPSWPVKALVGLCSVGRAADPELVVGRAEPAACRVAPANTFMCQVQAQTKQRGRGWPAGTAIPSSRYSWNQAGTAHRGGWGNQHPVSRFVTGRGSPQNEDLLSCDMVVQDLFPTNAAGQRVYHQYASGLWAP
jgi:hypothetical protein